MTKKETSNNQSMTNYPLPHQDASQEELLYAELDGKHTAMMEDEKRSLDFLYVYTGKLAPNKTIAKAFQAAYAKEKLGLWIPPSNPYRSVSDPPIGIGRLPPGVPPASITTK